MFFVYDECGIFYRNIIMNIQRPAWLTTRKLVIGVIVILVVGYIWYARTRPPAITYETSAVEQRTLAQTVEVTGEMKPADRISLSFQASGRLAKINVKTGDVVAPGKILAELTSTDQQFAVRNAGSALNIAQANLSSRLAGETAQSIRVAETAVEQAQANYDKAVADLLSTKSSTSLAVSTAENNLANQDAIVNKVVQDSLDSARTKLLTSLEPMSSSLTDGDAIIGQDASVYLGVLGFLDSGSVAKAKSSYGTAKNEYDTAYRLVHALSRTSTQTEVLTAANQAHTAIGAVQLYVADVQHVLAMSLTSTSLTATDLATKKGTMDGDYSSISTQFTTVLSALQLVQNSQLDKTKTIQALNDALVSAKTTAEINVRASETMISIQKASLDASKAALDLKKSPPRAVDVASLRAGVEQASIAYQKAQSDLKDYELIATATGTISDIAPSIGEQISMNAPVMSMVSEGRFDVEAKVPESDISKITVGQTAKITLDAYGDETTFVGTVSEKDPAETKVQDAVYYKIHVMIDPAGKDVKPGMTANVTVQTGSVDQAIVIPVRAIRTAVDGTKTVRVLINAKPQDRTVMIGLRGDEGRVQVLSGVAVGESVIVGETAVAK